MQSRALYSRSFQRFGSDELDAIPAAHVARYGEQWVLAGDSEGHSVTTLATKRVVMRLLVWFLDYKRLTTFDTQAIREFLSYARHGHNDGDGRWGGVNVHSHAPLSPGTIATYHRHISAFCNWMVAEDILTVSPAARVRPPVDNPDEVYPYTVAEIEALLAAARLNSWWPDRDRAVILLLLDTGIRESELTGLTSEAVSFHPNRVRVLGKGHKVRSVPFEAETRRAMWRYAQQAGERWGADGLADQYFRPARGSSAWSPSGVRQMIVRLAAAAGVQGANVHRFRHTAAITFLRAGGNVYELAALLGHQDLKMSRRYARIADTDVQISHRKHSPVKHLLGSKR